MGRKTILGFASLVGLLGVSFDVGAVDASALIANPTAEQIPAMMNQIQVAVAGMETTRTNVAGQLASARAVPDVVKVLSLNDILNQIDTALNGPEGARVRALRATAAAALRDADGVAQQLAIIVALANTVNQLSNQAAQTVGLEVGAAGDTSVQATIDAFIANDPNDAARNNNPNNLSNTATEIPVAESAVK